MYLDTLKYILNGSEEDCKEDITSLKNKRWKKKKAKV